MGSILAALHLHLGTFVLEILNFVLLFIFLRIFAWPPLVRAMEKRRHTIEDALAAAQQEREEAVRLRVAQQRDLEQARTQGQEIMERAQRAATQEAQRLLDEARAAAERLQAQAREELARERAAAAAELRREAADLVVAATGRLLGERVDEAADRRLAEEFVASVAGGAQ